MFDFDGTLVDTAPDLIRAAINFFKLKGLEPPSESRIRAEIGMGLRRLILNLFPSDHKDEEFRQRVEMEFIDMYNREFLVSPRLYNGVFEFLAEYNGQIAIVSNKRERFIKPILHKLGLDSYPWVRIVGGDTYDYMKPHPQPLMRVMAAAGVAPEETLMVGDGAPDIEAALAAGCRSVAVSFGYTPVDELMKLGATYQLESYYDLLPLVRSIT